MMSFKLVYPSKIAILGLVFLSSVSCIYAMEEATTSDSAKDISLVEALQKGPLARIDELIAKDSTVIDSELDREGNTPLHCAAASGQVDIVSFLLTRAAKIDAIDNDQRRETPLHKAAFFGHVAVVKALLDAGANGNLEAIKSGTPLHCAAHKGHVSVILELCKNDSIKIHAKRDGGFTPLHDAANQGRLEAVILLIQKKASVDACDDRNETPLHGAVLNGNVLVVKELLEAGAQQSARNRSNFTPLHLLIQLPIEPTTASVVRELLNHKSSAHAYTATDCNSFLYRASKLGLSEVVDLLISYIKKEVPHANEVINFRKGTRQRTALHAATSRGHKVVVGLLISAGADACVQDKNGSTPLHVASLKGMRDIVKLMKTSSVLAIRNKNGQNAMHVAAKNGNVKVVEELLTDQQGRQDSNLCDQKDVHGMTPLSLAAQKGQTSVVAVLLEVNKDLSSLDLVEAKIKELELLRDSLRKGEDY